MNLRGNVVRTEKKGLSYYMRLKIELKILKFE